MDHPGSSHKSRTAVARFSGLFFNKLSTGYPQDIHKPAGGVIKLGRDFAASEQETHEGLGSAVPARVNSR
jgi:hypothetical protein